MLLPSVIHITTNQGLVGLGGSVGTIYHDGFKLSDMTLQFKEFDRFESRIFMISLMRKVNGYMLIILRNLL